MIFESWRIPENKIARELARVGCETLLYYCYFSFLFVNSLLLKNFFSGH